MVVRIDVIEERRRHFSTFIFRFWRARRVDTAKAIFRMCPANLPVHLPSPFPSPSPRKPLTVLDENPVRKHTGGCVCGESKKKKKRNLKKSTFFGSVFLSFPVVRFPAPFPFFVSNVFCLQDGLHKNGHVLLLGSSLPSRKPPRPPPRRRRFETGATNF